MITALKIHKFRSFEQTHLSGFSRVNLIGGQNNSGKTVLLEALYLNNAPNMKTIMFLRRLRKESESFSQAVPERTWDSFFFNQQKAQPASIISQNSKAILIELELSCEDVVGTFEEMRPPYGQEKSEFMDSETFLSGREATISVLHLKSMQAGAHAVSSIIADSRGIMTKDPNIPERKKVNFISAFLRLSNAALPEVFIRPT